MFRSRASICKKNQLKRSYETQVTIKRRFKFKSVWIQILNFPKYVQVVLLDRGDYNEEVGVGFVGFGQTSKKLWPFEEQGLFGKNFNCEKVPDLNKTEQRKG